MDLSAFLAKVRDHYNDQFEAFVEHQEQDCVQGHAEVKFLVPPPTALHRQFMCVDFLKNDNGVEALVFQPEHTLEFEAFSGTFSGLSGGAMHIVMDALRWDNVAIHHELSAVREIDAWFEHWFDPEDKRYDPSARLGGIIHSLSILPNALVVDFGSASSDALLQLLYLLEQAGASSVRINDEPPALN